MDFDQKERLQFRQQELCTKLDILTDLRTEHQSEDVWGEDYIVDTDQIQGELQGELDSIEAELDQNQGSEQ